MVDFACILSAVCFMVSNILGVVIVAMEINREHFDIDTWKQLPPDYLKLEWDHRASIAPIFQSASIFNAFAWFLFTIPMIQLAWALSRGGKRRVAVHMGIASFAVGGALAELIARLLVFGAYGAAIWIRSSFELDNWLSTAITGGASDGIGWRALEVTFIITEGLILWIDAFEWIALFFVLLLIYFSVGTQLDEQRGLSIWWARLGLFIAFLTFVDFSADVLRLEQWRIFSIIAAVISFVNTVLLLPLWLLWLSCSIHNILPSYSEATDPWTPAIQGGAQPAI